MTESTAAFGVDLVAGDGLTRYRLLRGGAPVPYSTVLGLWAEHGEFRAWFSRVLADSPYLAYRWETPPVSAARIDRDFEWVLLDTPGFASRVPDESTFREFYDEAGEGIISFDNLGGDARLVVPSPRGAAAIYGHLAAFLRRAPTAQVDAFWCEIARQVRLRLDARPLWLSTAGGGVAWVHARLDARPKYYGHQPYRSWP